MELLTEKLKLVGEQLKLCLEEDKKRPSFIPLKGLEDFCKYRLFSSKDEIEQFVCFYIYQLLGNYFSNFGGDTPYTEEIHQARVDFYTFLASRLLKLSSSLKENLNDTIKILSEITRQYILIIGYLNK